MLYLLNASRAFLVICRWNCYSIIYRYLYNLRHSIAISREDFSAHTTQPLQPATHNHLCVCIVCWLDGWWLKLPRSTVHCVQSVEQHHQSTGLSNTSVIVCLSVRRTPEAPSLQRPEEPASHLPETDGRQCRDVAQQRQNTIASCAGRARGQPLQGLIQRVQAALARLHSLNDNGDRARGRTRAVRAGQAPQHHPRLWSRGWRQQQ